MLITCSKLKIRLKSCVIKTHLDAVKDTLQNMWQHSPVLTWCARHIKSRSCLWRNLATTSAPKVNETPRSFSPQPIVSLSGSDQRRSQRRPWSGTSVGRMIRRICSMDCKSGLKPPWQQNIFSSMIAAIGKQLKQSVNVFHNFMLYLLLPEKEKPSIINMFHKSSKGI